MSGWMELRCTNPACGTRRIRANGTPANPKLLARFTAGGLARTGKIEVKCPVCKATTVATHATQFGDDYSTYPAGSFRAMGQMTAVSARAAPVSMAGLGTSS